MVFKWLSRFLFQNWSWFLASRFALHLKRGVSIPGIFLHLMHHHHTKLEGFGIAVQFRALFYNLESLQKTMGPNQMKQPLKYYVTSRISKIRTKTSGFSLLYFYRTNCARPWDSENSPSTSQSLSVLFQLTLGPYLHLFIFWSTCFFKPISKKQTLTSELPQFLHKPVVRGGLSNPEIPLKFSGQKKTSSTFPLSVKGMGWGGWVGETFLSLNLKKKHTAEGMAIHPRVSWTTWIFDFFGVKLP